MLADDVSELDLYQEEVWMILAKPLETDQLFQGRMSLHETWLRVDERCQRWLVPSDTSYYFVLYVIL